MPPPPILDSKRVQQDDDHLDATSVSNLEDQTLNSYGSIPNIVEGNDDTIVDDSLYETAGTFRNKIARNRSAFAVFSLLGVVAVSFLALGGINRPFLGSFQETTGDITSDIAPINAVVTPSMTTAVKDSASSNGTAPANSDGLFKPLSGGKLIPVVVEPSFSESLPKDSLLKGFKLNIPEGGSAIRDHIFEGDSEVIADNKSYTTSRIITTVDDLQDVTGISGELAVSYGPMASGSGAGEYLEKSVSSSKTVRIMYYNRRTSYSRGAKKGFKPVPEVLTANDDEIFETYGTKYISSLAYGAQLSVIYTVTSESEIDQEEIKAQLQGEIGKGPLNIDFAAKFEKQEGQERAQYNLVIEVKVIGVSVSVPGNPTFEKTNTIIDEFNAEYDSMIDQLKEFGDIEEEDNVLKQLSPIGFYLEDIAPKIKSLDSAKAAAVASRLGSVSDVFEEALLDKAQLKAEKDDLKTIADAPDGANFAHNVYDDWKDEYDNKLFPLLEQKVKDCFAYRGLSAEDLFKTATIVPRGLNKDERRLVRGMLGRGLVENPEYDGVKYDEMRFEGYTLPTDGPIYYGAVYCNGSNRKTAGPGLIRDVFRDSTSEGHKSGFICGWGWVGGSDTEDCAKCCNRPGEYQKCSRPGITPYHNKCCY